MFHSKASVGTESAGVKWDPLHFEQKGLNKKGDSRMAGKTVTLDVSRGAKSNVAIPVTPGCVVKWVRDAADGDGWGAVGPGNVCLRWPTDFSPKSPNSPPQAPLVPPAI